MIWCGWKIEENYHVLVNQFHENIHSKTLGCKKIKYVFRDIKWCINASWGLKGLREKFIPYVFLLEVHYWPFVILSKMSNIDTDKSNATSSFEVISTRLTQILGMRLVEMAISTNRIPNIWVRRYQNRSRFIIRDVFLSFALPDPGVSGLTLIPRNPWISQIFVGYPGSQLERGFCWKG